LRRTKDRTVEQSETVDQQGDTFPSRFIKLERLASVFPLASLERLASVDFPSRFARASPFGRPKRSSGVAYKPP